MAQAPVQVIRGADWADRATAGGRWVRTQAQRPPLLVRYVLVTGALGLPASILQLAILLWLYRHFVGAYGTIELNGMWVLNFELGLVRNFLLLCAYTWSARPTWRRLQHAHVAAAGAFVIDIIAFNAIVFVTGIVPLAQFFGAGSGFLFNFGYNKLKTFAGSTATATGGLS